MSRPCYTTDHSALETARYDLGLSLDVRIIIERLKGPRGAFVAGRYTGTDPFHGWHNVWINPNQTVAAANASLWHELVHALQCERLGSWPRFDSEYRRQQAELGIPYGAEGYFDAYVNMPLEQEAWNTTQLYRAGALHQVLHPILDGDLILSGD